MQIVNLLAGWYNAISNYFGEIMGGLVVYLLVLVYYLFVGFTKIVYFAELMFKKLAGVESMNFGTESVGGDAPTDMVYAFITNDVVKTTFISILTLSIVLLIIFTIIALIKSEFNLTYKKTKSAIIGRSLKSLANFIVIPAIFLVSVLAANTLTKMVYSLFTDTSDSIMNSCFELATYNANRARKDARFEKFITTQTKVDNNGNYEVYGAFKNDPLGLFVNASGGGGTSTGDGTTVDPSTLSVADRIDYYFMNPKRVPMTVKDAVTGKNISIKAFELYSLAIEEYTIGDKADIADNMSKDSASEKYLYAHWDTTLVGYPNNGFALDALGQYTVPVHPMWNAQLVNYFYDMRDFDFLLGIGASAIIAGNMLSICFLLIKRALELVMLFLLTPVATAVAPIKGDGAESSLQSDFAKRLLSVIGPIFAYNMFFILEKLLRTIKPFPTTLPDNANGIIRFLTPGMSVLYNVYFQVICVIVGFSLIKSASTMFTSMLGIQDLVGESSAMASKAFDTATKLATPMLLAGKGGVKGVAKGIKTIKNKNIEAREEFVKSGARKNFKDKLSGDSFYGGDSDEAKNFMKSLDEAQDNDEAKEVVNNEIANIDKQIEEEKKNGKRLSVVQSLEERKANLQKKNQDYVQSYREVELQEKERKDREEKKEESRKKWAERRTKIMGNEALNESINAIASLAGGSVSGKVINNVSGKSYREKQVSEKKKGKEKIDESKKKLETATEEEDKAQQEYDDGFKDFIMRSALERNGRGGTKASHNIKIYDDLLTEKARINRVMRGEERKQALKTVNDNIEKLFNEDSIFKGSKVTTTTSVNKMLELLQNTDLSKQDKTPEEQQLADLVVKYEEELKKKKK